MRRIVIERNKNAEELGCAGNISGETDDGRKWILFLDADGMPRIFWPERDELGGVVGKGIHLAHRLDYAEVFDKLGVKEGDVDDEVVACFPLWKDTEESNVRAGIAGMRGMVFAVVPREGTAAQKMSWFLHHVNRVSAYPAVDLEEEEQDVDAEGRIWGTSDHPMTYSEHVSQPPCGLGSTND